ncbi:hypothetical protein J2W48_001784 [Flavobacterium piscis]|uniref:Uncharacterized protein n=1 Tax=Flavobacterium piscis TaxID=1114874 RepID=A0ABU1Y881_9FLAO|nr:hypothetical protein [Flavobacterium piscis]
MSVCKSNLSLVLLWETYVSKTTLKCCIAREYSEYNQNFVQISSLFHCISKFYFEGIIIKNIT